MQELEVTLSRAISVSWLLLWRSTVFGGIAGAIFGVTRSVLGLPVESALPLIAGGIAGFVFIVVVRMALRKKYRKFRIALLPHS
jgi:hypothetical protein